MRRDLPFFPRGTQIFIAGGNNKDAVSMGTLQSVMDFINTQNGRITLSGVYNSAGLWVDNQGDLFVTPTEYKTREADGTQPTK